MTIKATSKGTSTAKAKVCVIGHPIAHSRSPLIHNHWIKKANIDAEYIKVDVTPSELIAFINALKNNGFLGANVTIPHKEAVLPLCTHLTQRAKRLGAVNTLWFENDALWGDSTDGAGFCAHLDQSIPDWLITTKNVTVLGAGGAARSICDALLEKSIDQITIINRNSERAHTLAASLKQSTHTAINFSVANYDNLSSILKTTDLLINTTSMGMKGQPELNINLAPLPSHAIVNDIVYVPLNTLLLEQAQAKNLRTIDGLGMLLHQAVDGFAHWFGVRPQVSEELRAILQADVRSAS